MLHELLALAGQRMDVLVEEHRARDTCRSSRSASVGQCSVGYIVTDDPPRRSFQSGSARSDKLPGTVALGHDPPKCAMSSNSQYTNISFQRPVAPAVWNAPARRTPSAAMPWLRRVERRVEVVDPPGNDVDAVLDADVHTRVAL